MTRLKHIRKATGLKLREVAAKIGVTTATVHDAEVRGLRTPRAALLYSAAFPGYSWTDLLEPPSVASRRSKKTTPLDLIEL